MSASGWRLDVDRWPGPDRAKWGISHDIVMPSPDGRFACVLYSCHELRLQCEAGLLTILEGPPEAPTLLFQPPGFTCLDFTMRAPAQWLGGSRFVCVVPYLYSSSYNRIDLVAFTFLDIANRTFAHHREGAWDHCGQPFQEIDNDWVIRIPTDRGTQDVVRISPQKLKWKPWKKLRYTKR